MHTGSNGTAPAAIRRSATPKTKRPRSGWLCRLELLAFDVARALFGRLSLGASYRLFEIKVALIYYFVPYLCRRGLHSLKIAFPDRTPAWRRWVLRRSIRYQSWVFAEALLLPRVLESPGLAAQIDITEALAAFDRDGVGKDRGAIIISSHQGNGDLIATAFARAGCPILGVARLMDNPLIFERMAKDRARFGVRMATKRGFLVRAVHEIRDRGIACAFIDQDAGRTHGVFVPYFGRLASTTPGAAQIIRLTDSVVYAMFGIRLAPRRPRIHCFVVGPLRFEATDDKDRDLLGWTAALTTEIERFARQYPEQCLWAHRRWKSRPAREGERRGSRELV